MNKTLFIVVGMLYVLFIAVLFVTQRSFIYFPMGNERPDIRHAPWMSVAEVQTVDGLELEGWFQQPIGMENPTIVFFHGNAHNISSRLPKAELFVKNHYGVLLAEYRGYGGNPGIPSEEGLYKDGRAFMDWLLSQENVSPERIIVYGESLGAAVALKMAEEYDVQAVILETPFNSAVDVAQSQFFFVPFIGQMMWDRFDNVQGIQKLEDLPKLIGLAEHDSVIPTRFGQRLYNGAPEPKALALVKEAGHNTMYDYGFGERVIEFIEGLSAPENQQDADIKEE